MNEDFDRLRAYVTDHRARLESLADDPAEFDRVLTGLVDFWDREHDPEILWTETWEALARYPRVSAEIVRASYAEARAEPPERPGSTGQDGSGPAAAGSRGVRAARLRFGRETVASLLAVLIVLTALVILLVSVFRTATADRAATKDALVFANGLLGVVLGYYFGRIPGDARAENAEQRVENAQAELERTRGEVHAIVEAASSGTRGTSGLTLGPGQLDRLRAIAAFRHVAP